MKILMPENEILNILIAHLEDNGFEIDGNCDFQSEGGSPFEENHVVFSAFATPYINSEKIK